jgi:hypothetical protein
MNLADKATTEGAAGKARPEPRKRTRKTAKTAAAKKKAPAPSALAQELVGPMGQMTALTSKLIDLADAGLGLGMNVVSLLTSLAKAQIGGALQPDGGPAAARPERSAPAAPPAPAAEGSADRSGPRSYCIVNRTPLYPGSPVQVSFSINNDLPETAKNLIVSARGFAGAAQGFQIDNRLFAVEPPEKLIAAMDFDRFVLKGNIPLEAPEDSYNGWILVDGDEQLRIPVVLLVSRRPG